MRAGGREGGRYPPPPAIPPHRGDRYFDQKSQEILGTEGTKEKYWNWLYWNCCSFTATIVWCNPPPPLGETGLTLLGGDYKGGGLVGVEVKHIAPCARPGTVEVVAVWVLSLAKSSCCRSLSFGLGFSAAFCSAFVCPHIDPSQAQLHQRTPVYVHCAYFPLGSLGPSIPPPPPLPCAGTTKGTENNGFTR